MSTSNEIFLLGERLDLDADTELLPTFQANDRTKPDTIQSDYSPEFSAPGTARNHRLLGQAALASSTKGTAYRRLPAVLKSGGVETLPLASLIVKGYSEGRYQLQLVGGNRRLVDALGDKTLADLKLDRFNHAWSPANVAQNLPYAQWKANGWGYEVYDRGKPLDLAALDPYSLFPSTSGRLVWQQLLADAGFTADDLSADPLAGALNVPTTQPYGYSQDFRDARHLSAGVAWAQELYHYEPFAQVGPFRYTENAPWVRGDKVATRDQGGLGYVVPVKGYYKLTAELGVQYGSEFSPGGGVRIALALRKDGEEFFYPDETGKLLRANAEEENGGADKFITLSNVVPKVLLEAGQVIDTYIRGEEYGIATSSHWFLVNYQLGGGSGGKNTDGTATGARFEVELLEAFPPGGTIRLQDWLPEMKQLDFAKAYIAVLGLTVQTDAYRNHLYLTTGGDVLRGVGRAPDWTNKRDAYAPAPAGVPDRNVAFRFGAYTQRNELRWAEDELNAVPGLGNGRIDVADEALPSEPYEMVVLPFAATENSTHQSGLLLIPNYVASGITLPVTYNTHDPKPRLTLRRPGPTISGQLITVPAVPGGAPAQTVPVTTSASYFIDGFEPVDLDLQRTVLSLYWIDLQALLKETRFLKEQYRLTAADVVSFRFSVPIYDEALGGFFIVSKIAEFDARRPTVVELARINPTILPPPSATEQGLEFESTEFYTEGEFY